MGSIKSHRLVFKTFSNSSEVYEDRFFKVPRQSVYTCNSSDS
jgi:hypothetical protein